MQTKFNTILVSVALAIGLSITSVQAGPFKFRFTGIGSGSIGTTEFSNNQINLDVTGTTGSILIESVGGGTLDGEVTVSNDPPGGPIVVEIPAKEILSLDGPDDTSGDVIGFVEVQTTGGLVTLKNFDRVAFQTVPEPSSLALLLSVPAALCLRRRANK